MTENRTWSHAIALTLENDEEVQGAWQGFPSDYETVTASIAARIVVDPNVLGGEPHIRGTRVPVAAVLGGFVEGLTTEELLEHFPRLTDKDIQAALEYSATPALMPD